MRDQPVERVMTTPPVVVERGASVAAARQLMASRDIHHLPVVDGDRLVGIVGVGDLLQAPAGATVADAMHPDPVSVATSATLLDAAAILASGRFHALPVTAPGGAVVGVITSTDLIRALLQHLPSAGPGRDVPAGAPARFADAEELEKVVSAAGRHHVANDDPERLAAGVLYLNAKSHLLERVLRAADLYLHSGHGEHEHGSLVKAVTRAKEGIRPDLKIGRL